ncbi:MAG: membrane protein insertase YidC [candidate division Zixibacteria bacterium]|nr:membrane protein insertase YidC [candidate division Zixibacteria bacterium]
MDKKTVIGFILILAILFLMPYWQKIFSPPAEESAPGEQTSEQQTQQTGQLETPDETPTQTQTPDFRPEAAEIDDFTALQAPPAEAEKLITIETEDVIVVLSSHGGLIKSLQLKNYFVENGQNGNSQVELITPPDLNPWPAMGALTLGVEDEILPINSMPFEVTGFDISLAKGDDPHIVTFIYTNQSGASVRKDYTIKPEGFDIKLRLSIENPAAFGFDKELTLGWMVPHLPTEKDYGKDLDKFGGFYYSGETFYDLDEVDEKIPIDRSPGGTKWAANRSKYFTNVIMTEGENSKYAFIAGLKSSLYDQEGKKQDWEQYSVGLTFDVGNGSFENDFLIYSGPLDYYRLGDIGYNLDKLVDMGWKYFRPFAIGILWVFKQLSSVLFNYGLVIIVFSIIMKIVFWPLTRKSSTSMMKMKELQPKMQEIKAKFKDEPQKMNAETMKLYKEYGVNPFGSCLPLLVQMPIFWAMFSVLNNSIELRAAEFMFWITDLSQKDPYYVLVIIMAAAMFFQQKMTITDPKQKMMVYIMPVVFGFLFMNWPSGLVLYWAMFSIIGIVEQILVKNRMAKEKEAIA